MLHPHSNTKSFKLARPLSPKSDPPSADLGIYAESVSADALYGKIDDKTTRFKMLRQAAYLLSAPTFVRRNGGEGYERITRCHRWTVFNAEHVVIMSDGTTANYHNLELCESPQCPICGVRRAETARRELAAAAAAAAKRGWSVVLVTFTARHHMGTPCAILRDSIARSYRWFWSGRWAQNLKQDWHMRGTVRASEITYGSNGWHPHIHALVFMDLPPDDKELLDESSEYLQEIMSARWQEALEREGLEAGDAIGVDVKVANGYIAQYIAKFGREPVDRVWDVDSELAHSHRKKARNGGLTPLQMLSVATGVNPEAHELLNEIVQPTRDHHQGVMSVARDLWLEAYVAQKGDHLLRWSHGLKELLQVDEMVETLQAAADADRAPQYERIIISIEEWTESIPRSMTHFLRKDPRARLLEIALLDDESAAAELQKLGIRGVILSKH